MPARNPTTAEPEAKAAPIDLTAKARDPLPERDTAANLQQRMLAVMHAIGYIPKSGEGPREQGSYAFAPVEVIKDRVREECVRQGIMVHVSMDGRDPQIVTGMRRDASASVVLATVWGTITFVNVDDPEDRWEVAIHGQGIDSQDKALSKATTSAVKYGLLNAFSIPTGTDPDAEGQDLPAATHAPQSRPSQTRSAPRGRPSGPGPGQYADPNEPPPYGAPAGPQGNGEGKCPKHSRDWKLGQYGWYCSAKDDSTERGYCVLKPEAAWVAAHER